MKQKHKNIPIFIQHLGCPYRCVFCDQNAITNHEQFKLQTLKDTIENYLSTVNNSDVEIAFFGGSFTGIGVSLMTSLLDLAQTYVNNNKVNGIRFSTRPDYIDEDIIKILKKYSINEVELGIQSGSNLVLKKSKRGHTKEDTVKACNLLYRNNIPFGGQMMIGLPGSTIAEEIITAELICELGAVSSRIYPTIVFENTELADMLRAGEYKSLSIDDAVIRSKEALKIFISNKVNCLRVGLQDNDNLHNSSFVAGPNNPSFGELVKSAIYFDKIVDFSNKYDYSNKNITIYCAPGEISSVAGYHKHNKLYLLEKVGTKSIKILEKSGIEQYNIIIS